MHQLRLPATTTIPDYVPLGGGLDLLTPTLKLRPGYVRDALNWEQSIEGGYSRIRGYERTDGRPAPSAATYLVLDCNITGALAAGNTITGVTSAATGVVTSITGTLVAFTKATGSFVAGEVLNVGGTPRATVTALGGADAAQDWDAIQTGLAADVYRADIAAPAGSGAIRGGFYYAGVNYCFRDNAGATALVLYKETASGWTAVPFIYEVGFNTGSVEPVVGAAIMQGANSATVRAVSLQSGTWAGGTAAGRFIVTLPAPGNFAAGALTAGGTANLTGAQTAITMLPGGRIETDQGNLTGTRKVYGADGVNRMWEFDGTTLVPLATGTTPDTPTHPFVHKKHLWCTFGAVLKNSGITNGNFGAPYNWTVLAGAGEHRCANTINALLRQPGQQSTGAMSITEDDATEMMYGTSVADFQLVPFEESAGGVPYGAQNLGGQSLVFGAIGVYSIAATQAFGNFETATYTLNIRSFTQTRRNQCKASIINREKSQYRVFFNDGYGLYCTFVNGRLRGSMPVYFPNKVVCAWRGATPDGNEYSYFGSDNGFVYKLDAGTSCDGASIDSFLTLTFNAKGNSMQEKRYRGASFEVQGEGYATFMTTWEINYGQFDRPQGDVIQNSTISLTAGYWDTSGRVWDTLYWDGRNLAPSHIDLKGTGVNIAIRVESNSAIFAPFTLNSLILMQSPRKALKS